MLAHRTTDQEGVTTDQEGVRLQTVTAEPQSVIKTVDLYMFQYKERAGGAYDRASQVLLCLTANGTACSVG